MSPDLLYRTIRSRIGALLVDAGPAADEIRVPACPDWQVAQLVAHLAGTTVALVAKDSPGDSPQTWVDGHVAARVGRSAVQNWQEWDDAGPAFERLLVAREPAFGSLLYDAIIHEDDLCIALGRPAAADPAAIEYGIRRLFELLDRSARERDLGRLRVDDDGPELAAGTGTPVVSLATPDRWELLRALGGRRTTDQLADIVTAGDLAPWLDALHIRPPQRDLDER